MASDDLEGKEGEREERQSLLLLFFSFLMLLRECAEAWAAG